MKKLTEIQKRRPYTEKLLKKVDKSILTYKAEIKKQAYKRRTVIDKEITNWLLIDRFLSRACKTILENEGDPFLDLIMEAYHGEDKQKYLDFYKKTGLIPTEENIKSHKTGEQKANT